MEECNNRRHVGTKSGLNRFYKVENNRIETTLFHLKMSQTCHVVWQMHPLILSFL